MKKDIKKIVFTMLILLSLMITGCVKNEPSKELNQNDFKIDENVDIDYSFTVGIKDWQGEDLIYDSDYLEVPYVINNEGNQLKGSILVFINGIPQKYSISDDNLLYSHEFDINEKEQKEISLKIKPSIGVEGDMLNINFAFILNPDVVKELNDYRHNHSISQFIGANLQYKKSSDSSNSFTIEHDSEFEEFTEKEKENLYIVNREGIEENRLDSSFSFLCEQNGENVHDYLAIDGNTKIKVAGRSGKYIGYIVYDGNKISQRGFGIETSKDGYTSINIGELDNTKTNFYFLLVPTSTDGFIEQSERFILNK